jgi:6,7-dimethyl-8-ribityllumazine synthase
MKSGYAAPNHLAGLRYNGLSIALLATRWNTDIVNALLAGARRCLKEHGLSDEQIREFHAPGAYELPLACEMLLERGAVDAIIAVGAVIRGDTPHFDFVAGECSRGLMDVQLRHRKPIGFGVLTVNDHGQAVARAGNGNDNKGYECASAVLEMLALSRSIT